MADVSLTLNTNEYPLTVVDGTTLTLSLNGASGPSGPTGAAGTINTSTSTTLNGYIYGNGTTIAGATSATSSNVGDTLVIRDEDGNFNGETIIAEDKFFTEGDVFASNLALANGIYYNQLRSGTLTATRIITLPNSNGTVALTDVAQSWSGTQTFSGAMAITNAARPTSTASGTPEATSLMTRADVDAAPFDAFGSIISPKTATFGSTGTASLAAYDSFTTLFSIGCGSTATGYGRATINQGLRQTPYYSVQGINFSQAASIALKAVFTVGGTIPKVRLIVGGDGGVPASADADALGVVGYGFELARNASNQITMAAFRHNGTTFLKGTPVVTGLTDVTCYQSYSTFVITNDGSGTITAQFKTGRTINATSTVTGGPTTSGLSVYSYVDLVSVSGSTNTNAFNISVQDVMIKLS